MKLGIDVTTAHRQRLIVRLARLKTTQSVSDGGAYRECPEVSQVHLESTWTETELDDWLWRTCNEIDYQGVFSREEKEAA